MPKPITLIKKEMLEELYKKRNEGVPVAKIIRNHDLQISTPTLMTLFKYLDFKGQTQDINLQKLIDKSIFPEWLQGQSETIASQDFSTDKYVGVMPLGEWIKC